MATRPFKYLVLLAFALLIVAISSFWFSGPSFKEGDVVLKLEGPTQVSAGDEVTYKLKYSNETRSTLHGLDIVFFYPEGSTVVGDNGIEEDSVRDFKVEELAPGESGEKEFQAFLIGERGNIKIAKATLTFKAGSITSSFEKTATLSTAIVSTPISLTLVAPPSVISGGGIQYILDYRNESSEDVSDLIFEMDYPDGFHPQNFEPQPATGNNSWLVKSLKKGAGGRISITGVLNGNEGESQVAMAKLKLKIDGKYIDQQKASATTVISNPVLGLDITVNKSLDYSASLGDRLSYVVKYTNNSNITFSGMNLVVKLEGDMFDISNLDTRGGLFDDAAKTITWDTSTVPEFSSLAPNATGQVNFFVTVRSSFPSAVSGSSQDRFIKATATFGTPNVPTGIDSNEVSVSSSLITRVGTQPTFNQSAYYNDPSFGSFGPLPPRAGQETAFTIHWQLTNPGNDSDSVKIVAKLAPNIQWTNLVKAENGQSAVPTFNPNSNEVTWDLGKLPYGTGITSPKYEVSFQLKAKPSSTQVGNLIPLLENSRLTGMDSFTKQSLIINKNGITSDNLIDRPREGTVN